MKNPIVITSLEEDFRKIGLIKGRSLAESAEVVETDDADTDAEELSEKKGTNKGKTWRVKRRINYKTKEVISTKKTPPWKKAYNKKYYKAHRTEILLKMKKKRKSAKGKKQAAFSKKLGMRKGTRNEAFNPAEALKSFANAAIIAEQLQTAFAEWVDSDLCESVEDTEFFAERSEMLGEIAEHFAEIATAIGEADEFSEEDMNEIAEAFEAGLHFVLESVEVYESNSNDAADEDTLDEDVDADDEGDDEDGDEGND